MPPKKKAPEQANFEEALAALEAIVESMESGDIPLESLVDKYEEGTRYLRTCQKRLDDAELKIRKLKEAGTPAQTEPFDPEHTEDT